ncbi:MAG: ABC transporter ATP-binding protein [Burkholderiaceae bacterium]
MTATGRARGPVYVDVSGVSKTFALSRRQNLLALDNLRFDIQKGELVAVVGPSGCGKSTLLRIIAGLETPDTGAVRIGGESPDTLTRQHRLGVAFQDHALLPWLSVGENIGLPYRLSGMPVDQTRIDSLAAMVGLADFLGSVPRQLSGGMRQRVSIARAIVLDPVLLLLDEPFGALDLVTRRALNREMQNLWATLGTTTLLITHSVEEAVQLADRVIIMAARPGRIHAEFAIHLPRPRDRGVTDSMAFLQLVQAVSASLDDASAASGRSLEAGA